MEASLYQGDKQLASTSGVEASDPHGHESWFCRQVALAVKGWGVSREHLPAREAQPLIFHRGPQWPLVMLDSLDSSSARGSGAALAH